ncbi:MAG: pilus assembly protein TadG-related protein [Acidobacteriaceae bacterium]
MKILRDENGQALVLTALTMTLLVASLGLAVDVGMLFRARRQLQTAADAAATAGAQQLIYNQSATSAADNAAAANGEPNGVNSTTVTVNNPPQSGSFTSNNDVQVVIQQAAPTYFMRVLGINTIQLTAQAVATDAKAGSGCIYLMAPSGTGLSIQGDYNIDATGCGIYVNSSSPDALNVTGNGGLIDAPFLNVVGGSNGQTTKPTAQTTGVLPVSNPLGNITGPTPGNGGCTTTSSATSITGSFAAADGGAVCFTNPVSISNASLGAGTYVFESGVTVSGTVTISNGTLDLYGGALNQDSNSLLNITAPTSGDYNGIAILQPANNSSELQVQFGSSNQVLDGYIYAPSASVYLQDHGGGVTAGGIIAYSMVVQSSTIHIPSYNVAHPGTTPVRSVALVE